MKKMTGVIMMVLGAVLTGSGYTIYRDSKGEQGTTDKTTTQSEPSSAEKGTAFEGFIAKKFSSEHYTLKEWAGDKYIDGVYAESNLNPDLIVQLNFNEKAFPFAVECKYRSSFDKEIKFSYPDQFQRYKDYEKENNIPVFIALGIGGEPTAPEKLFILPLRYIDSFKVSREDIQRYKKDPTQDFFYRIQSRMLH